MRVFDLIVVALGSAVVAVAVPLFVLSNNASNFGRIDLSFVVLFALGVGIIGFSVVCVLLWSADRIGPVAYEGTRIVVYLATSFVFLTGLVFPLTSDAQQVEIQLIKTDLRNVGIALALAVVIVLILRSKFRGGLIVGMGAVVMSVAATSMLSAHSVLGAVNSPSLYTASSKFNIFVLSMDGVSGPIAREILRDSDELRSKLNGFQVYEHAISSAPATFSSLTSLVYGDVDMGREFGTMAGLADRIDRSRLLPNRLEQGGFKVSSYVYDHWHDNPANSHTIGTLIPPPVMSEKIADTIGLYRYATARMLSPALTFGPQWAPRLIYRLERSGIPIEKPADLRNRILNHKGVDWDAQNVLSVLEFEGYVDELSVGTSEPVAHFSHFLYPHFPVDFDEDCNYRSDDKQWFEDNQSREGVIAETKCVLRQYGKFVDKIRELGVFENSMIVLHSDHGIPVAYHRGKYTDEDEMESFLVRGQPMWGYARYTPFLAIKPFGLSSSTSMNVNSRPVILSDLANTICRSVQFDDCDKYPGINVLDSNELPEDSTYFVNIVKDEISTHLLDTHETIQFNRSRDFFGELHDYLTAEILKEPLPCGSVNLAGKERFNNGYTDNASWVSWRSGGGSYIRLVTPRCSEGRLVVEGTFKNAELNGSPIEVSGSTLNIDLSDSRSGILTIKLDGQASSMEAL